jgi:hypothetical protein
MSKGHSARLGLAALAVVAAACGHEYSEADTTTTTAATQNAPASQRAIDAITAARCQREARCDNIGANRHYVNRTGCMTQLRGEEMNQLTTSACPNGIDNAQLDRCLADIRGEHCENALDTIERISTCSTGALCPH